MATARKVTIVKWFDPASGKRVPSGTPGAVKRTARTKTYRAIYTDPRTGKRLTAKGFKDKAATLELARQLENGAARSAVGLPARGVAQKDLAELLELYAVK